MMRGTLTLSARGADAVQLRFEKTFAVRFAVRFGWRLRFAVRLRFRKKLAVRCGLRCGLKMFNTAWYVFLSQTTLLYAPE